MFALCSIIIFFDEILSLFLSQQMKKQRNVTKLYIIIDKIFKKRAIHVILMVVIVYGVMIRIFFGTDRVSRVRRSTIVGPHVRLRRRKDPAPRQRAGAKHGVAVQPWPPERTPLYHTPSLVKTVLYPIFPSTSPPSTSTLFSRRDSCYLRSEMQVKRR